MDLNDTDDEHEKMKTGAAAHPEKKGHFCLNCGHAQVEFISIFTFYVKHCVNIQYI